LFIVSLVFVIFGVLFFSLGLLVEMIVKYYHDYSNTKIYSIADIYDQRTSKVKAG